MQHAMPGKSNEVLANASFNAVKFLLKLPGWGLGGGFFVCNSLNSLGLL